MRGYDESSVWVDEPITEVQRTIVTALGFEVPEQWSPGAWACGAFAADGTPIVIRHLPYLPTLSATLKAVGFRWDAARKEWQGSDRTKDQVEVLQALSFCSGRYYPAVDLYKATKGHPEAEWNRRKAEAMRAAPKWAVESGTGAACPVRVGAYA